MTDSDNKLSQLYAEYERLKPRVDELSGQLKAITDAIKVELTLANPGHTRIDIVHPNLTKPMHLLWVTSRRLDPKQVKSLAPDVHAQCSVERGRWELRSD